MISDITNGIADFVGLIGGGISDKIFSLIGFIVDFVLFPINSLISMIFPNFSNAIQTFSEGLVSFVSFPISYFAYHIPPLTKSIILLYLAIMLGYYTILWTYRGIILIPTVINKIKFW